MIHLPILLINYYMYVLTVACSLQHDWNKSIAQSIIEGKSNDFYSKENAQILKRRLCVRISKESSYFPNYSPPLWGWMEQVPEGRRDSRP